jgi:hypothetical protein
MAITMGRIVDYDDTKNRLERLKKESASQTKAFRALIVELDRYEKNIDRLNRIGEYFQPYKKTV